MNRKQLILLLVALVVIGGACLTLRNRNQESWNSTEGKLGQKVLPNFQVNDVASMHIKGAADVHLVKKDDRWRVQERNDYPAYFSQISDLLIKMGDLKIVQAEPIGSSQLGRMHLAEPGSGPDSATLIEFKDAQGKVFQSLLLGKTLTGKADHPSPMSYGNGEMPNGRFVMLQSDPHEVLTVSDPLESVDSKPSGWLDRDFFKAKKLQSISFVSTNAADSWTLTRNSETSPWVLLNLKAGEVLDSNKVSSLSGAFSYPSFVDVAGPSTDGAALARTGLDKPLMVTVATFDHFTYTLKIGAKTPENAYNLIVAVAADLPAERTPGKDEKPDDKKRLDQEFQGELKTQQDKLQQEKTLDRWIYLVTNWTIDPLIRHRAQLMVGKKGDKKQADAASETMPDEKPDADSAFPPGNPNDQ